VREDVAGNEMHLFYYLYFMPYSPKHNMKKPELADYERAEHYKKRLLTANRRMIFFCVLTFIAGFMLAMAIFKPSP
jgi:hypothetical protein